MLKFISVLMLVIGYSGVAFNFYLENSYHLCWAMMLFAVAMYLLFY
jgi:hypothetical protein